MDLDPSLTGQDLVYDSDESIAPPYVSFSTFRTLLDWLRTEAVPLRFDRSFWQAKFSGSNGTQLVSALRFLGLLRGDSPLPNLERLANATPDERRLVLAERLFHSYAAIPFDELPRATPAMVKAWFRVYPIAGHTLRKAISFFVNAAKEAEIPMSNAVRKMAKSKSSAPAGSLAREKQGLQPTTDALSTGEQRRAAPSGKRSQSIITLDSGGSVTVGLDVDLFRLSESDRQFVLKLVSLTRSYVERQEEEASADATEDNT